MDSADATPADTASGGSKKRSRDEASTDTALGGAKKRSRGEAYTVEALEACSTAELRAIVERAGAIAARRTTMTPYPSCVPTALVLECLPLPSVAAALRVSKAWCGQAEATFRAVANRLGLSRSTLWRDAVRDDAALGWVNVLSWDPAVRMSQKAAMRAHRSWPRAAVNCAPEEEDLFVVGRGVTLEGDATDALEFDIRVQRVFQRNFDVVDAIGLAQIMGDGGEDDVDQIYIWNSDGDAYDIGPQDGGLNEFYGSLYGVGFLRLWNREVTLRVSVTRVGRAKFLFKLSGLPSGNEIIRQEFFCGHSDGCRPVVFAPIVRLFKGSSAKVLRAGPAARAHSPSSAAPEEAVAAAPRRSRRLAALAQR